MNLMESLMAQRLAGRSSGSGSNLTPDVKEALLDCFANVAWAVEDGQQYYDALEDALYGLQSISAVYTQSGTVYDTDSLNSLKADLVVTAIYGDGSTQTVPAASYTLSGTLTEGTSTITVSYAGKTTTFYVTVTHDPSVLPNEYQQVEWIQSDGNQVIATGASITSNNQFQTYEVEADASFPEPNLNANVFMGASSNPRYYLGNVGSGQYVGFSSSIHFDNVNVSERNTFILSWTGTTGVAVCGEETITGTRTAQNQGQFAFFSDYQQQYGSKCRIYRAKLRQNGSEIRDLVPCYRKADDVIGMYDIVNDVFYVNTGTGTFAKGGDI